VSCASGILFLHPLIEAAALNDTRRNDRLFACVAALVAGGAVRASEHTSWAHTMARYRFHQNDAVPLHALYDVARDAVRAQLPRGGRVYLAHDPSLLDFSGHTTTREQLAGFERVHVADREFDDLAMQRGMFAADPPERNIVRAQHLTRGVLHAEVP